MSGNCNYMRQDSDIYNKNRDLEYGVVLKKISVTFIPILYIATPYILFCIMVCIMQIILAKRWAFYIHLSVQCDLIAI